MLLFMLLMQTTATLSGEEGMVATSWDSSWTGGLQGLRGTLKAREMTGWVHFCNEHLNQRRVKAFIWGHGPQVGGDLLTGDWLNS